MDTFLKKKEKAKNKVRIPRRDFFEGCRKWIKITRDKRTIQAHKGVSGFSMVTALLKIGTVVFEKNIGFEESEKIFQKLPKSPLPWFFVTTCLY